MNDDRTDLEVFQQCRDVVFADWTAAAIFVPLRVWIGEKLLQHLLRCYLRAVVGKHRPQCCRQLNSYAGLIWSTREVNRRPTRLLGPTTTSVLRNLQWRFPIGTQPIVKTWRLRRLQFLDDTDVVGSPPCKLPPNRRELGIIGVREVLSFFLRLFRPHPENNTSTCYRAGQFSLAQDAENFRAERIVPTPLPGNPRATTPTGIYDRPQVGLSVKQIIGLIDDQGRVFAINRTVMNLMRTINMFGASLPM